jgi:hypothetical protein
MESSSAGDINTLWLWWSVECSGYSICRCAVWCGQPLRPNMSLKQQTQRQDSCGPLYRANQFANPGSNDPTTYPGVKSCDLRAKLVILPGDMIVDEYWRAVRGLLSRQQAFLGRQVSPNSGSKPTPFASVPHIYFRFIFDFVNHLRIGSWLHADSRCPPALFQSQHACMESWKSYIHACMTP